MTCNREIPQNTSICLRMFLGTFEKLRNATISWVMSVFLSARPFVRMEQLDSNWVHFDEIWCLSFIWKSVKEIQVLFKPDKNNGYVIRTRIHIYDLILLNS
jgi:hypothetical protein